MYRGPWDGVVLVAGLIQGRLPHLCGVVVVLVGTRKTGDYRTLVTNQTSSFFAYSSPQFAQQVMCLLSRLFLAPSHLHQYDAYISCARHCLVPRSPIR